MNPKETINIIGSGSAALTTAIVLRKQGFSVKVFDMAPDVGHRLNGDFLGRHYNPSPVKRLLLPLAKRKYESRVDDKNCNHENCSCAWCRCGEKACS